MIVLIGIPACGKSTFYKQYFFNNYMRISLDLFRTRNKEQHFLRQALSLQQRVVIDNTNTTKAEREKYISLAKASGFVIKGYYFQSELSVCLTRNESRIGKEKIERVGIIAKHKELALPTWGEGFQKLFYVKFTEDGFTINLWKNEI